MDPDLKDINTDKKLWQSQNTHPVCSGLFVTSAAAVAGSFHLARLELLWVNKRNLFLASLISILLAFFTPFLKWMRLFSGVPLCSSKTQLVLHPSKSPCTSVFCPPHQFSLYFILTIMRCLSRFPFLSISIQGWLEYLFRRPTLFLSWRLQAPSIVPRGAWWAIQGPEGNCLFTSELSFQPWHRTYQCHGALRSIAPWEMGNAPSNHSLICPSFWNGSLARLNVSRPWPRFSSRFSPGWLANTSRPAYLYEYIKPCACGFALDRATSSA